MWKVEINGSVEQHEVPQLRQLVGWERRDSDYPALFERCRFFCVVRDTDGTLVGFGHICGMGLQHGYLEDVIVHPDFQRRGVGELVVKTLLNEAMHQGIEIVTTTFQSKHQSFYTRCGFTPCDGGVWRNPSRDHAI